MLVFTVKGYELATSCIRDQDSKRASAKHNRQFMIQEFVSSLEFADLTEFPFHLRKTPNEEVLYE